MAEAAVKSQTQLIVLSDTRLSCFQNQIGHFDNKGGGRSLAAFTHDKPTTSTDWDASGRFSPFGGGNEGRGHRVKQPAEVTKGQSLCSMGVRAGRYP